MSDQGSPPPPPPPPPGGGYGQPVYGGQPMGGPPDNYLVWAILCTIFCCLPLGIVSIVFSSQVNSKWQVGDVAGAQESSRKAKQFAMWGAIIGAVLIILVIILYAVLIAAAVNSASSSSFSY